jgi:glycosyltransferase involved in cell wall biosynthesis
MFDFSVSILIPTYNRKAFEKLIEYNINNQNYKNIEGIYVADDSDVDEHLHINTDYPIHYYKTKRVSIGEKRHFLSTLAKGKYLINFDTDDFYRPNYISHSIYTLLKYDKDCCGSADMFILKNNEFYLQRCMYIYMLNEATMCMTKEFYDKSSKYISRNYNESIEFLKQNINRLCETKMSLMCCVSHNNNTIDKNVWCKTETKCEKPSLELLNEYKEHIKLLSTLNI